MMVEREDLGLSLSLSLSAFSQHNTNHHPKINNTIQLSLMPSLVPPSSSSPHSGFNPHKPSWLSDALPSSDRNSDTCRTPAKSHLRGIDVNLLPSTGDCDDVSSPNSTVSSISGKRSEREATGEELDLERDGLSDEDDGENSRKKLRLSKDQSAVLEVSFKEHNTLNPKQKLGLAKQLGLRPRQVEVWFQNRRARTKLKQTEVDCEFLKRCCENLTEENRRLQKEAQELRALKLSPQFYMQMAPPTTLTMCPSCQRVAIPSTTSTSPSTTATVLPRAHQHLMMPVLHPRAIPVGGAWPNVPVAAQQQRQFGPFCATRT